MDNGHLPSNGMDPTALQSNNVHLGSPGYDYFLRQHSTPTLTHSTYFYLSLLPLTTTAAGTSTVLPPSAPNSLYATRFLRMDHRRDCPPPSSVSSPCPSLECPRFCHGLTDGLSETRQPNKPAPAPVPYLNLNPSRRETGRPGATSLKAQRTLTHINQLVSYV